MGVILGIIFGASSLYLALKVGLTVSASIPVAVLSITLFRGLSRVFGFRTATILENNIVQTTGSAGESIAFGIAVTMPALMILGFDMELTRIMTVAVLGGLLGVLMMIPLRYALIVKEHDKLIYPEGTACAEVLIVGEKGGSSASTVFGGFFLGLFYKILNVGFHLWNDVPERALRFLKGASVAGELSPELLGVGYIIGPKTGGIMMAGGVLSSWILIPLIALIGEKLTSPLFPATQLIREMSPHDIWKNYILYIGAGAVATGGLISLLQSLPTIVGSARAGLSSLRKSGTGASKKVHLRTEQDLPMSWVIIGSIVLVIAIWGAPSLGINFLGALMIVVFGFLFVTVSSRLTGEIGSSSNPISGMTVATLLLTSLIFLGMGWVSPAYRVTALSIAAIVCVAASNGGTTSQDLKTGYLVGATPKFQQLGLLVGALTSALVIGFTLVKLNDAYTVYTAKNLPSQTLSAGLLSTLSEREGVQGSEHKDDHQKYHVLRVTEGNRTGELAQIPIGKYLISDTGKFAYLVDPGINGVVKERDDGTKTQKFEAPKARLMSLIIDGILTQRLPWGLVLIGSAIALVLELCGISALPFAVGVYLPLSSSSPIFIGGVLRWWVDRKRQASIKSAKAEDADSSPGVLYSSGLIAGGTIAGIFVALISVNDTAREMLDFGNWTAAFADSLSVAVFLILCATLVWVGAKGVKKAK